MGDLTYQCPCGVVHKATSWAAAHWDEVLTTTCDDCGAENTIRRGRVIVSKKPRKTRVPKCSS